MVTGAGGEHGSDEPSPSGRRRRAPISSYDVIPNGLRVSSSTPPGAWRGGVDAVAEEIRKRGPPGDDGDRRVPVGRQMEKSSRAPSRSSGVSTSS